MAAESMRFPETVDEFMEQYKIVDTEQIYTNGTELVPIFRMQQWFEHLSTADVRPVVRGRWIEVSRPTQSKKAAICECSVCGDTIWVYDGQREWKYCPNCGADMREVFKIDQVKEGAE